MSRLNRQDEFTDTVFTRDRATWWSSMDVPGVNVVTGERLTVADAYVRYLNWEVEKHQLFNGTTGAMEPIFAHHRSDAPDGTPLGFSTERFVIVQNREAGGLFHTALDGADYAVASIGALKHGGITFCSVDFVDAPDVNIAGQVIYPYLALVNAHDGRGSLRVYASGIRPECLNTIDLGWLAGSRLGRLNHTTNVMSRVPQMQAEIRRYLDLVPMAEATVGRLIDTPVTNAEFERMVARLVPIPEPVLNPHTGAVKNSAAITRAESKADKIREMASSDPRVGFEGTMWGAFQTFSTWGQKERSFRRTKGSGVDSREHSVLTAHISGKQSFEDDRLLKSLLANVNNPGVRSTDYGLVLA